MHIFGELEITPGGAVPFRARDAVEIIRLEQAGLCFQMAVFGETVFQLRGETAAKILLDRSRGLLRVFCPGDERFVSPFNPGEVVPNF